MGGSADRRSALRKMAAETEPDAVVARQFDERLRNAVERRYLPVLGVPTNRAHDADFAIADRLGIRPTELDELLIEAMQEEMRAKGIRTDAIVHEADRAGRAGKDWPNLLRLAQAAAERVAAQLLPPKEPLLLVQIGPVVRYRLDAFRTWLLEASKAPDAASILLLIPSHDTGGILRLYGEPPLPVRHPSHALWIPPGWRANRHDAAAWERVPRPGRGSQPLLLSGGPTVAGC